MPDDERAIPDASLPLEWDGIRHDPDCLLVRARALLADEGDTGATSVA